MWAPNKEVTAVKTYLSYLKNDTFSSHEQAYKYKSLH